MGNSPLQHRKHVPFSSPSSSWLSTRPFAPTTAHPSSSHLPKDQLTSPVQAKGFGYSFERIAVYHPDSKVIAGNESEPVSPKETTNLSPLQLASDEESLAEPEQSIPTARESTVPAYSSASALQRMPTSASNPDTPKPPPVNRQTGTKRTGWSIEHMAITHNPLPPAQRTTVNDAPTTQETSPQTEVLQQQPAESATPRENTTGLPNHLKAGIESLSGLSLDDVHVHYNSSRPAQVNALAYTQGTEIHVGPGQEQHLAHEAWHVVQQKEGRVQPTLQAKGMAINDDVGLEREADVMGERASSIQLQARQSTKTEINAHNIRRQIGNVNAFIQRMKYIDKNDPNIKYDTNIESFSERKCFNTLTKLKSGNHDNILFEKGDEERLLDRLAKTKGETLKELKEKLKAKGDDPGVFANDKVENEIKRRNMTTSPAQLNALLDEIRTDSRVLNFDVWLYTNAFTFLKNETQLLDYINELREMKARFAELSPSQKLDIAETPIPSSAQTADIAYGNTLVEVKTVQNKTIKLTSDLNDQILNSFDKFRHVGTGAPCHIVIYASYDEGLLKGGLMKKNVRTRLDKNSGDFIMQALKPDGSIITEKRQYFFEDTKKYIKDNAPTAVVRVDIRMENGPSYHWERKK